VVHTIYLYWEIDQTLVIQIKSMLPLLKQIWFSMSYSMSSEDLAYELCLCYLFSVFEAWKFHFPFIAITFFKISLFFVKKKVNDDSIVLSVRFSNTEHLTLREHHGSTLLAISGFLKPFFFTLWSPFLNHLWKAAVMWLSSFAKH